MSGLKYSWQQAVVDAFGASAEMLPVKINIAKKAIAARQKKQPQPDAFEHAAIREALQVLAKLVEEPANAPRKVHFHIRWSSGKLDWERFDSRREAESSAQQLARTGETYNIEELGQDCEHCRAMESRATSA